ncbi:MAG: lipoyl synthase [Candidatus Tectomicrobia bacterium]|uniref:Lipoyl synthase n=1 Tax=Tectimicrobiota bacterium TaxID=2528274 RepID=A0A932G065_UNCTE|nr:lipoyl synthase [Candidatus Tectomicrobia bacterium]
MGRRELEGRKPPWLRVRAPGGANYIRLKGLLRDLHLHTVCEEARCPNIGECFEERTATFLILGGICTRACGFCAVTSGEPEGIDLQEPERVAQAVSRLGLRHAVVTSVTRDDLEDGGARLFAQTIQRIRAVHPGCRVEVLIPDFQGSEEALGQVLEARPEILNHNLETVPRLYPRVRPQAQYDRSRQLLDRAKRHETGSITKSGLMLGLGETWEEVLAVMADLREVGCQILTLGQYLRPSPAHLPIARYYRPEEFAELSRQGEALGFDRVEASPLVRSSYHAARQATELEGDRDERER